MSTVDLSPNAPSSQFVKSLFIENPTANDLFTIFKTQRQITIRRLTYILVGNAPTATLGVRFGPDRSSISTEANVGGTAVASTTIGDEVLAFDDAVIPAGSWIALEVIAISAPPNNPDEAHVTLEFS